MSQSSFILTRAPMRITLGGGGTDVMWYSKLRGGAWLSAAINAYVHVTLSPAADGKTFRIVHPDGVIESDTIAGISHEVVRACLEVSGVKNPVEIYVKSDIGGRSGLGGSGAFEVALLQALAVFTGRKMSEVEVGQMAASVEIDTLKYPVGPQDQYISALGGVQYFEMDTEGNITVETLNLTKETVRNLQNNLLFYRTNIHRDTKSVLGDQKRKVESGGINEKEMIAALDEIKELGAMVKESLLAGDTDAFGSSLHEHWNIKKRLSSQVSSSAIDDWYDEAIHAGALGGKIMGAGGGGYFMFYVNKNKDAFRRRMEQVGLVEELFSFEPEGVKTLMKPDVSVMSSYDHVTQYFSRASKIAATIDRAEIAKMLDLMLDLKKRQGRLFILGIGGSAANASHAVNDFRKIGGIETYAPTDNVSELTARANDESWEVIFSNWLKGSHLSSNDAILVLSVGGGKLGTPQEKPVSPNIVVALQYAKEVGAMTLGIVSRDGGYTRQVADACVMVPVISDDSITPLAESFQAVVWHALVTHPAMADGY